jgi:anthranilate synthase/aminodeoxychorismate synthase-like glutamine amidotransferase
MSAMAKKLLIIDNYDSFTYNLVQAFMVLDAEVMVFRNDEITLDAAQALNPTHLCISPGPGNPSEAGVSKAMIDTFAGKIPVLGVCLGHQSITEVFGGKVIRNTRLMHGKTSQITHDGMGVFTGLRNPITIGRYHSLVAESASLPADLLITAQTADHEIMGIRHRQLNVEGVQFHPESVLTPDGPAMMARFLQMSGGKHS